MDQDHSRPRPVPPTTTRREEGDALALADATLRRGAAFFMTSLGACAVPPPDVAPGAHRLRSRVIGNGLRELDRFLNILIDEALRRSRRPAAPRQRNTANKLSAFRAASSAAERDDHARLIALGRSRDCLFHCNGLARRADARGAATMTLGWPDANGALRCVPLGGTIALDRADLESVSRFYLDLADELVRGA